MMIVDDGEWLWLQLPSSETLEQCNELRKHPVWQAVPKINHVPYSICPVTHGEACYVQHCTHAFGQCKVCTFHSGFWNNNSGAVVSKEYWTSWISFLNLEKPASLPLRSVRTCCRRSWLSKCSRNYFTVTSRGSFVGKAKAHLHWLHSSMISK